jgi:hypothetical protein
MYASLLKHLPSDSVRRGYASLWGQALQTAALTYIAAAEREGEGLLVPLRRSCGIEAVNSLFDGSNDLEEQGMLRYMISICLGTALGLTMLEGESAVYPLKMGDRTATADKQYPAALYFLETLAETTADGSRMFINSEALRNPYVVALKRRCCCTTCGRLPPLEKTFPHCALCRDPACGRFCSKRPCFEAFWRAGHRDTCAGRGKGKGDKKGGKGK